MSIMLKTVSEDLHTSFAINMYASTLWLSLSGLAEA